MLGLKLNHVSKRGHWWQSFVLDGCVPVLKYRTSHLIVIHWTIGRDVAVKQMPRHLDGHLYSAVRPWTSNINGNRPWLAILKSPTVWTVLSDGIKLLPVKHISCKRSNPAKHTLAPLSGKTYITVCIGWGISPVHLGSRFGENGKNNNMNLFNTYIS